LEFRVIEDGAGEQGWGLHDPVVFTLDAQAAFGRGDGFLPVEVAEGGSEEEWRTVQPPDFDSVSAHTQAIVGHLDAQHSGGDVCRCEAFPSDGVPVDQKFEVDLPIGLGQALAQFLEGEQRDAGAPGRVPAGGRALLEEPVHGGLNERAVGPQAVQRHHGPGACFDRVVVPVVDEGPAAAPVRSLCSAARFAGGRDHLHEPVQQRLCVVLPLPFGGGHGQPRQA